MNMLHAIYRHNTYKHPQPEIKGIFKHELNIIVSIGGLLIDFFHRNCYVSIMYDLTGISCEIIYTMIP